MKITQDIRNGWQYAVCDYPEGTVISTNQWVPTTHSSIWKDMTAIPVHGEWEAVDLPHVWNKDSAAAAGPRLYEKKLTLAAPGEDNRYYVSFGGVFGLCRVFVNGVQAGEHKGGYTRFRVDITPYAVDGENTVTVFTDNTVFTDITPLSGDFAKYGGIYRETELINVGKTHFDCMYYGTDGVIVDTEADGTTKLQVHAVGGETVRVNITDAAGKTVAAAESNESAFTMKVDDPALWNGLQAPNLYTLTAELLADGEVQDSVTMQIGYRKVELTADKGFFLNDEHLHINGVAKHQDRAGCGPAATNADLEEDMALIKEIGANAVRLSHYPHPQYFYDLCDRTGMVVWAEIPMLSMPDGNEDVMVNARQQMTELLMQYRHHPSIVFWGVQNEVAIMGETIGMRDRVQDLHDLVKKLKPDAITASSNEYTVRPKSALNQVTDLQAYNLYYGWYYGEFEQLGDFFDKFHRVNPNVPIGISEYGVDCRIDLHQRAPKRQDYSEEYQSMYHEATYPIICKREWVWGSFIWNMFEFSSPYRNFDPLYGLNRKGLVTFDRKTRKDSFYYYKACWSKDPVLYLCERRYEKRVEDTTVIKVYSNQPEVTLKVNGKVIGTRQGSIVFTFENVALQPGVNTITAFSGTLVDSMVIQRVEQPEMSYVFVDPNAGIEVRDWVTGAEKTEDLFPEGKCSILDELRDLYLIPDAWAVLEKEIPELTGDRYKNSGTSVLRAINRLSGKYEESFVKELNKKLGQIDRPELDD